MAFGPIVKKLSRIQSTSQNPKICARIPESKTLPRTMCFWILGSVLDSDKCFGFWESDFEFWEVSWIMGRLCPYEPIIIIILVVAQFLKKDKSLQITNIYLFPGNSFRQLLASLSVLFYQLSFRQSLPNFFASSEVHAKVGILKRECANETHLFHSDPSKYILDNLANDRRISYYLEHTVSLLNFLKVLFFLVGYSILNLEASSLARSLGDLMH